MLVDRNKAIIKPEQDKALAKKARKPKLTLSGSSSAILEEIYQALGGPQGSVLFWKNREDLFRTMIESKYLVKQAIKEANADNAENATKNIFLAFIQNNGLAKKQDLPQVEATVVNPQQEEKNEN